MDFMTAMDVAASGLSAERKHMNIISMNLANIQTTRTQDGTPYQRKQAIFRSAPVKWPFDDIMSSELRREVKGVKLARVENDNRPYKEIYDPEHPDANDEGYVQMPDINVVEEMANMLTAARVYEANLSSISTIKNMLNQALQIGR
ncbi:MAG: flagellar basal body rod protein FlgC [Desulfohalobiaceae bacterium]